MKDSIEHLLETREYGISMLFHNAARECEQRFKRDGQVEGARRMERLDAVSCDYMDASRYKASLAMSACPVRQSIVAQLRK